MFDWLANIPLIHWMLENSPILIPACGDGVFFFALIYEALTYGKPKRNRKYADDTEAIKQLKRNMK